jgi:multiple sugar transport system ATP-binding protein
MASVRFAGISKVYQNDIVALKDFDLCVEDGEFLVLVGPSGCGKSTTLRLLAGLENPTSGRLFIDGRDVTEMNPQDRDIAMVFQSYALYPHMTVFDNMAFSLKMRKVSGGEIRRNVMEAADILGITDYLDRRPRELSGGQKQRVALGRAIVRHPAVFLFDEPLSNLDAKLRVQMRNELSRLHTQLCATMIYVTHDQAEAMTLGDRIVVLKDGIIQQVDIPLDLYNGPNNRFVAGFIGSPSMNFLPVSVNGSGELRLAGRWDLEDSHLDITAGEYTFGIRPEDVRLDPSSPMKGSVEVIETLGNEKLIYIDIDGLELVIRSSPDTSVLPGDVFPFAVDTSRCHLFDSDGTRVNQ